MSTKAFMAYENETDSFLIDNLTVENRHDRISLYGSFDITKDQQGLEYALKLKRIIDASIDALKRDKSLPEHIETKRADNIENSFL
ncbi:hypothetical protein [Sulfuricurvum sp.]|uniref:hypothetical protein n=1 Tax=Sulfuricurvum sp. TaxID=2025608 RepID=UPI00356817A6